MVKVSSLNGFKLFKNDKIEKALLTENVAGGILIIDLAINLKHKVNAIQLSF